MAGVTLLEPIESSAQCVQRARLGAGFMVRHQLPDGRWRPLQDPPLDCFYRAPWTLGLMGETAAAHRCLNYVRAHFLADDGDLVPRAGAWYNDVHYQYPNAHLVAGAQKLGRYDLVRPTLPFLLSQQDAGHGGFYAQKAQAGRRLRADSMSSAAAGLACLAAGEIQAARRTGSFFVRMCDEQPEPDRFFYYTYGPDGRLDTAFAPDEARLRRIDTALENQVWYAIGLPLAFAVLLHDATGEENHLRLSQRLFAFMDRCVNPWDGPSSGKGGWACSMLYRVTGEPRYKQIALRVANNLGGRQSPNGWFARLGQSPKTGEDESWFDVTDFDRVAEFTMWLGLIGSNLLGRDST
jgi:hypothetical protein